MVLFYILVNAYWKIVQNFWCLGCESTQQKKYKDYSNLKTTEEFTCTSDPEDNTIYITKIPKPDLVSTNRVQPAVDNDVIDDTEIIGDFDYGDFITTNTNDNMFDEKLRSEHEVIETPFNNLS